MSKKYDISKFKDRFKKMRMEKKITQEELGSPPQGEKDALRYKRLAERRTISNWEQGNSLPKIDVAIELCDILDCDFDYLFGKIDTPHREATDIREETGLSEIASENLVVIANARLNGPMDDGLTESSHDNLRQYEIGRFAKIRVIEALLENDDLLEKISVCAYDYLDQMRNYKIDPFHTVGGIRHDQFANIAKQEAQETLSKLFERIVKAYSGDRYQEWEE